MVVCMNEKKIWDFLLKEIGNPFGAAGLMGNLYAESGLRPDNLQNTYAKKLGMTDASYTAAVDDGSYSNFVRDSAGYGLAQWTYWSRKQNLLAHAKEKGASIGNLDMQLDFLMKELATYTTVIKTLRAATSVKEASDIVLTKYERPADQSDAAKARRASYGQKYYDNYTTAIAPEERTEEGDTMTYDPKKVIEIALAEVGYLEKETNAQLDDKTANAGDENYTKYARDLDALGFYNGRKQHVAWCDVFADHCYVTAYGMEAALALTFQPYGDPNCGAGCKYSRQYYKKAGRLFDTPEPGDQVFFYSKDKSSISHTGIVYDVDDTYVYTVEGNTSGASGVISNGGGVCKKKYKLTYDRLAGFGRPGWEIVGGLIPSDNHTIPPAYKLGDRTLSKGCTGDDVKQLQEALNELPCIASKLTVDGDFGNNTARAVYTFQTIYEIKVDSKYGPESHRTLMAALDALKQQTTPEPEQAPAKRIVTIVSDRKVNLRSGDSTKAGRVTQVVGGTQLEYVTTVNGWHGVRWKNRIAWVSGEFSTVSEA